MCLQWRSATEMCTLWGSETEILHCGKAQPKCVHCGEAYPANYRGCSVAIELQKFKNQNMKTKRTSLIQRQPVTQLRQANNTTEAMNQNFIP
jgi:hypothetical protein